jgi:hypothetical protein
MDAQQKIRNTVNVDPNTGCWLWQGAHNRRGYGRLYYSGKDYRAHRLAYVAFVGPIPNNMLVCHRCDVPQCVNPEHLFLGTAQDNESDKVSKGRQTRGDSDQGRLTPCTCAS